MRKELLVNATGVSTGNAVALGRKSDVTFQASGSTSSGTGAATVLIEVSNDNSNWVTAGTISLTLGTTATNDGFTMQARWPYCRAKVTAISGTGAALNATVSK